MVAEWRRSHFAVSHPALLSSCFHSGTMDQKTVLITGCSSGIGLALAVRIAKDEKKRFKVYATMRNPSKSEKLAEAAGRTLGRTLEIKQLDVCDEQSIKACVDSIPNRRIDVLISNAGMGLIGPIECQSLEEMKAVMDTNFFGLVRLLKEILPDMKRRKRGHIVVISSVMGIQGILFNDIYAASKFAVEGFCESLAVQALRFNLNLTLIEPGPVITEFERKVYEEGLKMDLSAADKETANMFTNIYLKNYNQIFQSLGQSPEDIAEHTHKIITTENPPFRHQTNKLYTPHDHPQVRRSQRRPAHRHLLQNGVRARQNLQRQPQLHQNAALGEPQELQPGEASAVKTRGLHQRTPDSPLQQLLTFLLLPCVRPVHPSSLY